MRCDLWLPTTDTEGRITPGGAKGARTVAGAETAALSPIAWRGEDL